VPDEELMFTTDRTGESSSAGSAAWIRKNGARTLVATCSSKWPTSHSRSGMCRTTAALFTSPSIRP